MARKVRHNDVEFAVGDVGSTGEMIFDTAEEASVIAIDRAVSGRGPQVIDVLVSSRAGAKWYGGEDAVEVYDFDPDASVHERFVVRAESVGRIP
jgi:hypothetical protein